MSLLFGTFWLLIAARILLSPFWLALWVLLTVAFAWMFYERYWRWADCFNELGRCYDTDAGVMALQAAFIWGLPALICAVLLALSLWGLMKRRTAP